MKDSSHAMLATGDLAAELEKLRRGLIAALFVGVVVFILFEALRGYHYWDKVKGEGNLWNYGSSLLYFLVGELAILNAIVDDYRRKLAGRRQPLVTMMWVGIGAAFTYFACDEMLQIHERLGLVLQEYVPSLGEGDGAIMAAFAVIGLVSGLLFIRKMLAGRLAFRYFLAGLLSATMAGVLDVIPRDLYIGHLPFRETEELAEVFAAWAFSSAFITSAVCTLAGILSGMSEAGVTELTRRAAAGVRDAA